MDEGKLKKEQKKKKSYGLKRDNLYPGMEWQETMAHMYGRAQTNWNSNGKYKCPAWDNLWHFENGKKLIDFHILWC